MLAIVKLCPELFRIRKVVVDRERMNDLRDDRVSCVPGDPNFLREIHVFHLTTK